MTEEEKKPIDPRARKPVVYMSDPRGIIQPVLAMGKETMLEKGWGLSSKADYLKQREEIKAAAAKKAKGGKPEGPAASKKPEGDKGKEDKGEKKGEYTLEESIAACRQHGPIEEIAEQQGVDVTGLRTVAEKRDAVLAAVAAAKEGAAEEAGADEGTEEDGAKE